jgi:hypothetical protein
MRATTVMEACEASGLDERYRPVAYLAATGDAFARELLEDAISARARRMSGLACVEAAARRRAVSAYVDGYERVDNHEERNEP